MSAGPVNRSAGPVNRSAGPPERNRPTGIRLSSSLRTPRSPRASSFSGARPDSPEKRKRPESNIKLQAANYIHKYTHKSDTDKSSAEKRLSPPHFSGNGHEKTGNGTKKQSGPHPCATPIRSERLQSPYFLDLGASMMLMRFPSNLGIISTLASSSRSVARRNNRISPCSLKTMERPRKKT